MQVPEPQSASAPGAASCKKNLQKNSLKYLVVSGEVRNFAPANEAAASLSPPQTVITRLKTGKFDNDSKNFVKKLRKIFVIQKKSLTLQNLSD